MSPELRKALTTAGRKAREAMAARDDTIRRAVAEGCPLREVGTYVGLSHMAVRYIAHGRKPR